MATQSEGNAATQANENSPFHVLMLPDGQRCDSRRKLDESLVGDYLGKRHDAYNSITPKKARDMGDDEIWSGASTIEKWLIWCCELPQVPNDEGDATLPGALRRDRVLEFVGYLALYCHEVTSRALAISILERTLEADLPALQIFEAHQAAEAATGRPTSNISNASSGDAKEAIARPPIPLEGSPTTRGRKRMIEMAIETPTRAPDNSNLPATLKPPPRKPDRLLQFLAAGGLKILEQWVEDASKPVPVPKDPPNKSSGGNTNRSAGAPSKAATKESLTGALLLPLLILLRNLPFHKPIMTQCKIIKVIRNLSKEIDAEAETKKSKSMTHPRAGGLPVVEVQEALNELKSSWNAQQKLSSANEPPPDPFQAVKNALAERLREVRDCNAGTAPAPAWLVKAEEAQKRKGPPAKKKRGMSTEEMNRIEHQQERDRLLKENLQKAEQERREVLKKLREMKDKQEAKGRRAAAVAAMAMTSRKRIRWKDGLGHTSKSRKRDELEEVFVFLKNSTAATGTVKDEISNYSLSEGNDADEDGLFVM